MSETTVNVQYIHHYLGRVPYYCTSSLLQLVNLSLDENTVLAIGHNSGIRTQLTISNAIQDPKDFCDT